jgi:hypothetical protein
MEMAGAVLFPGACFVKYQVESDTVLEKLTNQSTLRGVVGQRRLSLRGLQVERTLAPPARHDF